VLRRGRKDEGGGHEAVELVALADGTLAPERRVALEARVAASSELAGRLAEQQRAVMLARGAAAEVKAPATLRARVGVQERKRGAPVSRRFFLLGATTTAALGVTLALAISLSGTSAQRFHAALAPVGLAPGPRGEATLTRTSSGWRIELDAKGLPRLDGGGFYEAWLRNPAGVLVPVGTFNEGQRVTLWAGVSPGTFTKLTVTRERADGDQASSGEKVLVGTVQP
jgi:hypothetical protein